MVDSIIRRPSSEQPTGDDAGPAQPVIRTTRPDGIDLVIPISLVVGLKTYVAAVINSAVGASKNHIILFNATGSGKRVRVWQIFCNPNITAAVAGTSIVLNIARTSTIGSAGTAITIKKTDTADPDLPAQITARTTVTTPTITTADLSSSTCLIEETSGTEGKLTLYKADSVISALVLNENEGLVIQQGAFVGVGAVNIFMYFTVD